ncbi:MAG: class I SAM-dependent methyltransferase [Acidobacteria bacterium]|nr:MAG: class I SAM-dependent methyltransferase [Acidobacteriota bacterium]REK02833.1 MAG: class I SAM-dependent methyltransferase [Acidobacteriota bacterium]REK13363.1 MAG: class I SAM-dependent methyltransferase [Acidobacteriota bacterium]REK41357.1 MAG: class I SAM-dependent methyltransferase [Acidobacteriota bacterium]
MFRSAEADPSVLFVGIDANPKPLQKISIKAERALAKRGSVNAIYVQSAAEDLPEELNNTADEIVINFPWGSLLGLTINAEPAFLASLARILKIHGSLAITTAIDPIRDAEELKRLGIKTSEHGDLLSAMVPRYSASGLVFADTRKPAPNEYLVGTTWERKLRSSAGREPVCLRFRKSR